MPQSKLLELMQETVGLAYGTVNPTCASAPPSVTGFFQDASRTGGHSPQAHSPEIRSLKLGLASGQEK